MGVHALYTGATGMNEARVPLVDRDDRLRHLLGRLPAVGRILG